MADAGRGGGSSHDSAGNGKIFIVTGQQGSGKTTLVAALASARDDLVHFDGDVWALGFDPTLGPTPPPESKVANEAEFRERHAAISAFLAKFRDATGDAEVGEEPAAWQPFYAAMCDDAISTSDRSGGKTVVVVHSVYRRAMRAFIKDRLGPRCGGIIFVNPPPAVAIQRAAARCAGQYAAMGKTVEEWATLLGPNSAGFQRPTSDEIKELSGVSAVLVLDSTGDIETLRKQAEAALGGPI